MPNWNATQNYSVDAFLGINQMTEENKLASGYTRDCANMDTTNGNLTVGMGFREILDRVPSDGKIHRMYYWHTLSKDLFVVCAGDEIYSWNGTEWQKIFDYQSTIDYTEFTSVSSYVTSDTRGYTLTAPTGWEYTEGCYITFTLPSGEGYPPKTKFEVQIGDDTFVLDEYKAYPINTEVKFRLTEGTLHDVSTLITAENWDFEEVRIGDKDHLIIANGQTQLVKYDGTNANLFGTGEYVYEGTCTEFEYNATKAISALYVENTTSMAFSPTTATKVAITTSGSSTKLTLTMPSGWSYSAGVGASFICPCDMTDVNKLIINDGTNDHTMEFVPSWAKGDFVTITMNTTTTATVATGAVASVYGTFTIEMPQEWDGGAIAFTVPSDMASVNELYAVVNGKKYKFNWIPIWASGDVAMFTIDKGNECSEIAFNKATSVSYAEAGSPKVGTYTITMPQDWRYTDNCYIRFTVPTAKTNATQTKLSISGTVYTMDSVKDWAVNQVVAVQLNANTSSIEHTVSVADSCVVTTEGYEGACTLTMPSGWSYTQNSCVYFSVTEDVPTLSTMKVVIGDKEFKMKSAPKWKKETLTDVATVSSYSAGVVTVSTMTTEAQNSIGDSVKIGSTDYPVTAVTSTSITITIGELPEPTAGQKVYANIQNIYMLRLKDANSAEPSEDKYGILSATVSSAIDVTDRCKAVGLLVNDVTRKVKEIDESKTKVTFEETITEESELGCSAKVRGGLSDIHVNYIEIYYSRLFSAGDKEHPSRLYWSQPPGDTRNIEDWSMDNDSDATGGGFVDVGNTSSDPIIGLVALSNQLLIFKETSMYRLLGDRPTNYRVSYVNKDMATTVNTSIIANGDIPYWLTKDGLYYHDGQAARISGNARMIHELLEKVDLTKTKSAMNNDRLYFTCRASDSGNDDSIIIYDMKERNYLLRNGFEVIDLCSYDGNLYMINSDRYIYKWDKAYKTYRKMDSGVLTDKNIEAYWQTPLTDLSAKSITKAVKTLYFRGEGNIVKVDIKVGKLIQHEAYMIPDDSAEIVRIPLYNEGRTFSIKLYNEEGGWFSIHGGLDMRYELKEDG